MMSMLKDKLCVVYGSDDNYAKFMGISMYSLFETNTTFEEIVVYILDCGITQENKDRLAAVAEQWHREISFIDMRSAVDSLNLNMGAHKIAIASYAVCRRPTAGVPRGERRFPDRGRKRHAVYPRGV